MVPVSVRFLLFTRTAAIIEIWPEHDIEPKIELKTTNNSSLCPSLLISCLRTLLLLCLAPYGCSTEINIKDKVSCFLVENEIL